MKTIEQIAREVAETATLSDTQNPETGAYEPIIEDFDQLAAFIEDGIRADRAQRIPATSASDRYDAARALLTEWDAAAEPDDLGLHNAGGFGMHENARIREVLRALVEHPEVSETANDAAMRIWGSKASADLVIATRPHHAEVIALLEAMWHAGINAGWEDWEPENAPGMVDTRATDVIDIVFDRLPDHVGANFIDTLDGHARGVKVGEWVTRPDGYAALRIEVVR